MTIRSSVERLTSTYGRAVGGPVLVNAVSQVGGLLQYVLLIIWVDVGHSSDFYFLLLSWTSTPMQLILTGVCYPLLLRGADKAALRWMRLSIVLVPLSCAPVMAIFASRLADVDDAAALTILTVLFSGSVLLATYDGFGEAVRGNSLPLSSATIAGSLGGITGLLVFHATHIGNGLILMSGGALSGEILYLSLRARRRSARLGMHAPGAANRLSLRTVVSSGQESSRNASGWYLGKSVAGYGGGLALQSYSASLAPAFLSYFSIAQRVVGGFAGVFSNSVLPFLVHGETDHPRTAGRVTTAVSAVVVSLGVAAALGVGLVGSSRAAGMVLLVSAWLSISLYAAGMQRLAYRLLSASAAAAPIATSIAVLLCGSLMLALGKFTPAVLLASMVLLDGVSSVIFAFRLSLRRSALLMCVSGGTISVVGTVLLGGGQ